MKPPTSGKGQDWVLVIDDSRELYDKPGATIYNNK